MASGVDTHILWQNESDLKGSRDRLHIAINSKETSQTSYKRVDKRDLETSLPLFLANL